MEGQPFVARRSIPSLFLLLLICLGFLAVSFWLAGLFGPPPKSSGILIGWAGLVFSGACSISIVRRMVGPADQIVVNEDGIFWKQWSDALVPWTDIATIDVRSFHLTDFVCVHLKPSATRPTSASSRVLQGFNRRAGFGQMTLSAGGTDRSFEELVDAIFDRWPAKNESLER
jgi:hypothetical protein